jgi:hypothetical protein
MKIRLLWLIIFCCGWITLGGCVVPQLDARKAFGISNPVAKVNLPDYGSMDIPTNARIRLKMDKNPDGSTKVDFTMASDAAAIDIAEGGRADVIMPAALANQNAQLQSSLAATQMMGGVFHDVMDVVKVALPLMARPPTPDTTPQGGGLLEQLKVLCAANPTLPLCAGLKVTP